MYELGFENNPLGAENCMSSKFENLKLLDSLEVILNFFLDKFPVEVVYYLSLFIDVAVLIARLLLVHVQNPLDPLINAVSLKKLSI